jgi:hypothetical protein
VVKNELLVHVAIHKLVVKLGVEDWIDFLLELVGCCEDGAERNVLVVLLVSLLLESLWPDDLGVGELLVPWSKENVVLLHQLVRCLRSITCAMIIPRYLELRCT